VGSGLFWSGESEAWGWWKSGGCVVYAILIGHNRLSLAFLVLKKRLSPNAWLPACSYSTWEIYVLGDARKQSNRDLNGFGRSCALKFITELHLESTLAAAASIRARQGAERVAA
jgi:hypothetical protein